MSSLSHNSTKRVGHTAVLHPVDPFAAGRRSDADLHLKTAAELRKALAEIERLKSDYLKTAADLREALAEIERLRSDADLHLKTAAELREALAENEHLRSGADLHLKTAAELRKAIAENERLRSDAHLHLKTAAELREALAENKRLRSDAVAVPARSDADAKLYRGKVDRGMNTSAFWRTDWF
jgi:hypothetical protein